MTWTMIKFESGRALILLAGLIFPLACIWFPEDMGKFVGGVRPLITNQSPRFLVLLMGWILLLLFPMFYLFFGLK